ncbi:hypothetical protein [Algoriphagus limi]|uniref:Uncharacterized protein n=1 Tax=Algoriphagus limi TaxID=2975273 RepID=A0ABT2G914_9BACT|nr:hypothetical protein [Algoriphagus limi]MCS5491763.1 hypothetical protein [Algoriphagus limi]
MEIRNKFLNFPIQLLQGFLNQPKRCLRNIIDYAVYQMVYSEDAIFENIDDFMESWEVKIPTIRIQEIKSNGKYLFERISEMTSSPWTGIHISTYFSLKEEEDEFRFVCFLAFTAFKSIIQKRSWAKVSNDLLLARMAGYPSQESNGIKNPIPEKIQYWMKPKSSRRKKIFEYLEKYNRFVYLPKSRGITFSLTLSFENLAYRVEEKKALKDIKARLRVKEKERILQKVKGHFDQLRKNPP